MSQIKCDPLSLFNQFAVEKREVYETEKEVLFGDTVWLKSTPTDCLVFGTGKDGKPAEYYTVECIMYLLNNIDMQHGAYVKKAAKENIQVVRRPDRKELILYLRGETNQLSIRDKTAPLPIPVHRRAATNNTAGLKRRSDDDDSQSSNDSVEGGERKRVKFCPDTIKLREEKLAKKTRLEIPLIPLFSGTSDLTKELNAEEIQALRVKRVAKKRTCIKKDDFVTSALRDSVKRTQKDKEEDKQRYKEIQKHERAGPTRGSVLQGKRSFDSVLALCESLKRKDAVNSKVLHESDEANKSKPVSTTKASVPAAADIIQPVKTDQKSASSSSVSKVAEGSRMKYNRYEQENFSQNSGLSEFNINPMGSFQVRHYENKTETRKETSTNSVVSIPLESVLPAAKPLQPSTVQASSMQAPNMQAHIVQGYGLQDSSVQASIVQGYGVQASSVQATSVQAPKPEAKSSSAGTGPMLMMNIPGMSDLIKKPADDPAQNAKVTADAESSGVGEKPHKRTSRTPIIIIPAGMTSLITMINVKDMLQDFKFMTPDQKRSAGAKSDPEVLIQRMKPGSVTTPYKIIDNPSKLSPQDWDRVVAVFVMGPAWQFKGWPWGANPVQIFSKIKAYHIKLSDQTLDSNIKGWNVTVLNVDRHKRHLDTAVFKLFWDSLDKYMMKFKPHLRM